MNDSDRLLAEGIPLELADGRTVYVRYSMRSLKAIEDAYGSLDAVDKAMTKHITGTVALLSFGLIHEGIDADALLDLLDTRKLPEYINVLQTALDRAMPEAEDTPSGKANRANASNGTTTTTSPLSGTGAAISGSGQ